MACKLTVSSINELGYREFIVRFGNVVEGNSLCAAAVYACGLEDLFLPLKTSWEQCASLLMTFLKMKKQEFCEAFLTLQLAGSLCHETRKGNKQKQA